MLARRGVTLLELMTVVIVIGILAAIAVPQFFRAQERIRGGQATNTLGTIRSAQIRFRSWSKAVNDLDAYGDTMDDLDFEIVGDDDWTYNPATATVPEPESGANPDTVATRTKAHGGDETSKIYMDLLNGHLCTDNTVYGLTTVAAGADCL